MWEQFAKKNNKNRALKQLSSLAGSAQQFEKSLRKVSSMTWFYD